MPLFAMGYGNMYVVTYSSVCEVCAVSFGTSAGVLMKVCVQGGPCVLVCTWVPLGRDT